MIKELQKLMDRTFRMMNICHEYHELKAMENKNSPNKLKLKEAKLQLINKQTEVETKEKEEPIKKKKKNVTVYLGHENWNLVLNLMVGLRKSVKSLYELNNYLELKANHFTEEH